MIVTDLDKSLLRSDKTISEFTKTIFNKCKEKNIIIVFATARPIRSTKAFIQEIKPNAVIYHNGAIVIADQKELYCNKFSSEKAKILLKTIEEKYPESTLSIDINDKMYTNFDTEVKMEYQKIDFNNLPNFDVEKIIIGSIPIEKIIETKQFIPKDLYLQIDSGEFGVIMNKGVSKWNGIKELMKYYKIKSKEIVSFGDDYNDILMVKNCGIGVAMENGIEEIKKSSKYICKTNDEDGIANWINNKIL